MEPVSQMLTLCGNAGPLPEKYRPFLNDAGDLQAGDTFGLEAAWILSMVSSQLDGPHYPEDEWTQADIDVDGDTAGCCRCGDEDVVSEYGICDNCFVCYSLEARQPKGD